MRVIKSVEMANDNEVYEIRYEGVLGIRQSNDGDGFDITLDDEEIDWAQSKEDAEKAIKDHIADDHMIISGYGKHSGRKFWQLPERIQQEIIAIALKSE